MLEALEHPLESPRIFEAKERGECFAEFLNQKKEESASHQRNQTKVKSQLGHLPLTSKGRVGCSALSSPKNPLIFRIFDFGILDFRF